MKKSFEGAWFPEPSVNEETQSVIDNAGLSHDAECVVQALAYCLEMLFRGKDRLPAEIEESVSTELRDLALDITDDVTTIHNPSKEELHRFHSFNDTHPNVAWPYALVEAIMYDVELSCDSEGNDPVWRHNYMGHTDAEEVEELPETVKSMQNFFADTVLAELDGFIRAASAEIGRHFETGPVIPHLVFVALEQASQHYEEHGLHLTEVDIETWFPNFYSDLLEQSGSREVLAAYEIQIH